MILSRQTLANTTFLKFCVHICVNENKKNRLFERSAGSNRQSSKGGITFATSLYFVAQICATSMQQNYTETRKHGYTETCVNRTAAPRDRAVSGSGGLHKMENPSLPPFYHRSKEKYLVWIYGGFMVNFGTACQGCEFLSVLYRISHGAKWYSVVHHGTKMGKATRQAWENGKKYRKNQGCLGLPRFAQICLEKIDTKSVTNLIPKKWDSQA